MVVTSAIEAATLVMCRLGSQAAKCAGEEHARDQRAPQVPPAQTVQSRPLAGEQDRQQGRGPGGVAPEGDRQSRCDDQRGERPGQRDADDGDAHDREVPAAGAVQGPRGRRCLLGRAQEGTRIVPLAMGTTSPRTVAVTAAPADAVTVQSSTEGRPSCSPCRTA